MFKDGKLTRLHFLVQLTKLTKRLNRLMVVCEAFLAVKDDQAIVFLYQTCHKYSKLTQT